MRTTTTTTTTLLAAVLMMSCLALATCQPWTVRPAPFRFCFAVYGPGCESGCLRALVWHLQPSPCRALQPSPCRALLPMLPRGMLPQPTTPLLPPSHGSCVRLRLHACCPACPSGICSALQPRPAPAAALCRPHMLPGPAPARQRLHSVPSGVPAARRSLWCAVPCSWRPTCACIQLCLGNVHVIGHCEPAAGWCAWRRLLLL
jgi:hypothetical protein